MTECTCPHLQLGNQTIEARNWSPRCKVHGLATAYFEHLSPKPFGYADPADQVPDDDDDRPEVWDLVIQDMRERDEFGMRKYGRPLRPRDGRDTLQDAYEEALDLAVYLRKAILERDGD